MTTATQSSVCRLSDAYGLVLPARGNAHRALKYAGDTRVARAQYACPCHSRQLPILVHKLAYTLNGLFGSVPSDDVGLISAVGRQLLLFDEVWQKQCLMASAMQHYVEQSDVQDILRKRGSWHAPVPVAWPLILLIALPRRPILHIRDHRPGDSQPSSHGENASCLPHSALQMLPDDAL